MAEAHHGVITLAQLESLGLTGRAVRNRVATGRLRRLHSGIYSLDAPLRETLWAAAVLACGDGSLLSHRSAAALWGIAPDRPGPVEVIAPRRAGRTRGGVAAHHCTALTDRDVDAVRDIPCTSLARTLLDLAAVVGPRALERAVDRAEELRRFDLAAVEDVLERNRGARGAGALRSLLRDYSVPTTLQSGAEERFLRLVQRAGLPRPRVNGWIALEDGGYRPDFLWDEQRLIVEVDGRPYHARRRAFRHDRRRDRRLALAGYETRRFDAAEVMEEPERVVREVVAFLAARPPVSGRKRP